MTTEQHKQQDTKGDGSQQAQKKKRFFQAAVEARRIKINSANKGKSNYDWDDTNPNIDYGLLKEAVVDLGTSER